MIKKLLQRWLEIPRMEKSGKTVKLKSRVPDVPRTAMGWPVFGPEYFTLAQLILEARRWRGGSPGTVGGDEWKKYTDELIRRGFSTKLEIENDFLPDEVQRRERPNWYYQIENM